MRPTGSTLELEADVTLISNTTFIEVLHNKFVRLEEISINENLFLYWRKKGLLPFFQKGSWARFSYAQVIWLKMLLDLRELGYSIDQMLALAEYLFRRAYDDDLPQRNLEASQAQLEKKKVAGTIDQTEQEMLDYLDDVLTDPELLHSLKYNINYLSNLLVICLNSGEETGLLLFSDNSIAEFSQGNYYSVEEGREVDISRPHIYLSIPHYLKTYVRQENLSEIILRIAAFSDSEKKIIREVRDHRNKELRIELRDGVVQKVEATAKERMVTAEQAERIRAILGLHNYEKITVDTMDEKTLMLRKTRKRV